MMIHTCLSPAKGFRCLIHLKRDLRLGGPVTSQTDNNSEKVGWFIWEIGHFLQYLLKSRISII